MSRKSGRDDPQLSLLSISSAAGFPAKTSAPQAKGPVSAAHDPDSGSSTRASSKKSSRGSSSSKTLRSLLRAGWTLLSAISSTPVTASTAIFSPPLTLEHRISENASSSWPTPVTTDAKSSARGTTTTGVMHSGTSLTDAIRMWPTPTASEYGTSNNGCPGDGREEYATKGKPSLSTHARREGGILNPDWVETLMGLPVGWTDGPLDPDTLSMFGSQREP